MRLKQAAIRCLQQVLGRVAMTLFICLPSFHDAQIIFNKEQFAANYPIVPIRYFEFSCGNTAIVNCSIRMLCNRLAGHLVGADRKRQIAIWFRILNPSNEFSILFKSSTHASTYKFNETRKRTHASLYFQILPCTRSITGTPMVFQ